MKLNNNYNSENNYNILVNITVDGDTYTIGRFKFENSKQFENIKNQIQDDHYHPTDGFCELIKSKYPFLDMDDIFRGMISFNFIDNIPVIEL